MADEGASPRELLLEACRRNNNDLLDEVLVDLRKTAANPQAQVEMESAITVYTSRQRMEAVSITEQFPNSLGRDEARANYSVEPDEVLDNLLDQEGLEVDPIDRLEQDTPLHKAVRYTNGLNNEAWGVGQETVILLLDAGADPRVRNKAKLKPYELVDPRNAELRSILQKAEFATMAGNDVVDVKDEDEGPTGSASDSE
ncbi:MAG: hypothetical protein M1827_004816 [Pycnora praestabilis]|nr:MAG: hypothetical protein M1827_004816 [Pycnora praestabilis]